LEKLLDVKELSELTSIKVNTLRAWVFQKRIPCVRINGLVRFKRDEIESWLAIGDKISRPRSHGKKS